MLRHKRIAVYFDCENISSRCVTKILSNLGQEGNIVISNAYADWRDVRHKRWLNVIKYNSINRVEISNAGAKNSADIQIVIDAMDAINLKKVDMLVIVSNDSDFTGLINNAKSKNIETLGYGEIKALDSYKNVYHKFIELNFRT